MRITTSRIGKAARKIILSTEVVLTFATKSGELKALYEQWSHEMC